jgi:hypothetical protein
MSNELATVPEQNGMSNELATVPEQNGMSSFISPVVDIASALARYNAFNEFVSKILKKDKDFGEIPGTNKPTLLKAGAEKLGAFFGLRPLFAIQESVNDWTGKDHNNEAFFFREYKCQLYRNGELVGEGIGSCNSWEKKYRYRWMNELEIPAYVDKSSLEYKDGSISEFSFAVDKAETSGKYGKPAEYWKQFKDAIANGSAKKIQKKAKDKVYDAWEIGGKLYAVPNKDVSDQVNTIDKMAQKRAFVAAILIATNASDYFTQDMEDFAGGDRSEPHTTIAIEGQFKEENPKPEMAKKQSIEPDEKLKAAEAITGHDGIAYGQCTTEVLKGKRTGIVAKLNNKDTLEIDKPELLKKLDAINTIIESRG